MARKKTDNPFFNYVRVREPNKEKLAELVLKAKGENRSISAFARDCGVSTSTLSRLINMETSRANSDDLIATIAENAAPDSGVTINELLDAHGLARYILPGNHDIICSNVSSLIEGKFGSDFSSYYLTYRKRAKLDGVDTIHMLKIVTEHIYKMKNRKYISDNVEILTDNPMYTHNVRDVFKWESRMKKKKSWQFHVHTNEESLYEKLKEVCGELYLVDRPERKSSIITVEDGEFKAIKMLFANRKIKDCVSLILVDLDKDEVVDEFQFPMFQEWGKKWMLK